MIDSKVNPPRHFFLSYARSDKKMIESILGKLIAAEIPVWLDKVDLRPGTANWETAIREAVRDSFAMVLACSPDTAQSENVQAEVQLATRNNLTVFPVWIRGDTWVDSVPLSLASSQYIDCRAENIEPGISLLVEQLRSCISRSVPKLFAANSLDDCPPGFVPIICPTEGSMELERGNELASMSGLNLRGELRPHIQLIFANPQLYSSFERLLDDIYTQFLRSRFAPYTYGRDWVLAKVSHYVSLLAVPWEWLRHKQNKQLIDLIPDYVNRSTPLSEYGMGWTDGWGRSAIWAVVDAGFEQAYGLFTSDDQVAREAFDTVTKGLSFTLLRHWDLLDESLSEWKTGICSLADVDPSVYKYRFVIVPDRFSLRDRYFAPDSVFVIKN